MESSVTHSELVGLFQTARSAKEKNRRQPSIGTLSAFSPTTNAEPLAKFVPRNQKGGNDIITMDDIAPRYLYRSSETRQKQVPSDVERAAPAWVALKQRSDATVHEWQAPETMTDPINQENQHSFKSATDRYPNHQIDTVKENDFVKVASPTAKFDDLAKQAIHLWTSGVDLELPKEGKPKSKKSSWMTETEFEEILADKTPKKSAEEVFTGSKRHSIESTTKNLSYAKVAAQNVPSWVDNSPSSSSTLASRTPQDTSNGTAMYPFTNPNESRIQQHLMWQPSVGPQLMGPTVPATSMAPINPRLANSYGYYGPVSPFQGIPMHQPPQSQLPFVTEEETNAFRFLDCITRDFFGKESVEKLDKHLDRLLAQAPCFSHRTFKKLISAINFAMVQEQSPKQHTGSMSRIAKRLQPNLSIFFSTASSYIQAYIQTPIEILSLLELFSKFAMLYPDSLDSIPLESLASRFNQLRNNCKAKEIQSIKYLFEKIETFRRNRGINDLWLDGDSEFNQDSSEALHTDGAWDSKDISYSLPHLPNGDDIVRQALLNATDMTSSTGRNRTNSFTDKDCPPNQLVNRILPPWSINDLNGYLMSHYMLLWEEVCGTMRNAFQQHVAHQLGTASADKPWAIYNGLHVCGTTLSLTFMDPSIVFRFKDENFLSNIHTAYLSEGSLVMLIPDDVNISDQDDPNTVGITEKAITGVVVHSVSANGGDTLKRNAYRMVAIHVDREEVSKIRWSATYTLITTHINGSATLAVLSWLRKEYLQLKDQKFPSSLVPRILTANNELNQDANISQLAFNGIDQREVPDYLQGRDLDISCLVVSAYKGYKATPGGNNWPRLPAKAMSLPPSQRPPLYKLSTSQVNAVRHALSHRVTVISGAAGTGKTFLASKLVQLTHQALVTGQCYQPVLVLTRTESTLDNILGAVVGNIPDLIRMGSHNVAENLVEKQAVNFVKPSVNDPNRKQVLQAEKALVDSEAKLASLWRYRSRIERREPAVMCTAVPPRYMNAIMSGVSAVLVPEEAWKRWTNEEGEQSMLVFSPEIDSNCIDSTEAGEDAGVSNVSGTTYLSIFNTLLSTMFHDTGHKMVPIMSNVDFHQRKGFVNQRQPRIAHINTATYWPLPNSGSVADIRRALADAWSQIPPQSLWHMSTENKRKISKIVANILLSYIDKEIDILLKEQFEASKFLETHRVQKWTSTCRFSRLIGTTADFAAANQEIITSLRPRVVIVDEASGILESTIAVSAFGPRTEHLILLGDGCVDDKPKIFNDELKGAPRNLDVSLFERWKLAGGEVITLDEQWRMCAELADVQDSLGNVPGKQRLLITKPVPSKTTSLVDRDAPALKGVTNRLFFVDYQGDPSQDSIDIRWSNLMNCNIMKSEVDEAQYVYHLALYLYQQGYKSGNIAVLTLSKLQKDLIKKVREIEVPKRTCFFGDESSIIVDQVEDRIGYESWIVVLSLSTPCSEKVPDHHLALALSRSRYGLYVVGRPSALVNTRWDNLVRYTKEKGM
ncbi:hypothetical protein EC973_004000 [Apophysomyces ossiformis]|uniref:DNA2/NAM7 helicase-like C-terminal domain-containing protein n=1 Tax=Apophysomyces ossiformis TaxID=679940 RepID=A0A8H7ERH6_9FUNG|nr:hypothetical protein EC973_004000 [Apophysomyces ossiformis]